MKAEHFLAQYRPHLAGRRAAIYVGGGFKAISLIRQFAEMGIRTVVVGTQTGSKDDYEVIRHLTEDDTVILDDTNPAELERFMREMRADILVGGVKERPLAYKLGIAFCDHNHETGKRASRNRYPLLANSMRRGNRQADRARILSSDSWKDKNEVNEAKKRMVLPHFL